MLQKAEFTFTHHPLHGVHSCALGQPRVLSSALPHAVLSRPLPLAYTHHVGSCSIPDLQPAVGKARLPWFFASSDYSLELLVATLVVTRATR